MIGAWLRQRGEGWIDRRHPVSASAVQVDRRRLYILPSSYGVAFAALLLVLFLWSTNYSNSMGFGLTFLLVGVGLNAMWRTHWNLLGLGLQPTGADAVFAGEHARFRIRVIGPDRQTRPGLALQAGVGPVQWFGIDGPVPRVVEVRVPTTKRGHIRLGRLRLSTVYPLGLFRAWTWAHFDQSTLVYPRPQGDLPLPAPVVSEAGSGMAEQGGGREDFAGLRTWHPGDSLRHVAWRASVRSERPLVKRFSGQGSAELVLDWDMLAPQPVEERLGQLCRWVLAADERGLRFGLRLPGTLIQADAGEAHYHRCLEALALYPEQPA